MPLNLASPGIVIREVDLTVGRVDPNADGIGAIVAPFANGPVNQPVLISNEQGLLNTFGKPYNTDKQYEHWLVASSYLAYGGSLQVVRADDIDLKNAAVGSAVTSVSHVKIKSYEDYVNLGYDENLYPGVTFSTRYPGSWGNGIKVAIIDSKADQILSGISTTSVTNTTFTSSVSVAGTVGVTTSRITGINTSGISIGQDVKTIFGIIGSGTTVTAIGVGTVFINPPTLNEQTFTGVSFNFGTYTTTTSFTALTVGCGITQSVEGRVKAGVGVTSKLDGYLKGVVTGIGVSRIDVKVISHVSAAGTETEVDYQVGSLYSFENGPNQTVAIHTNGVSSPYGSVLYQAQSDWFEAQNIELSSTNIPWQSLAPKPSTSNYARARNCKNDEVHVVVIDDDGDITGNAGTILEKHLSLSKASDAEFSVGAPSYWRKYISENSEYIFAGSEPAGVSTVFVNSSFAYVTNGSWDKSAANTKFHAIGSKTLTLNGGVDYNGKSGTGIEGSLKATIGDLSTGYQIFENDEEYAVDFLLMGGAGYTKEDAQALASSIISVAEIRKDAVAFVSPNRTAQVTETSTGFTIKSASEITDNVLSFYSGVPSSSYAIFDSGYKYMYDRFGDTFRYVPLNGDIAGLCARNDATNFPWFSPAGTSRGGILNAVKLAYNPSKSQRDRLYSARINPVILSPGDGIILFGDKTGLSKASAFDRINVRRLFIYLEGAIKAAAKDVMFEFNDALTRSSFVNAVEPFLRDVQAKRGIQDYRLICDESNNTAAIIDNNEFIADIYIKPSRSINFIGLTFVATRSGVSFSEVIGV
jgi:hypothetical protein